MRSEQEAALSPDVDPVPLQDPAREYRELAAEIDDAVAEVLASGRYVLGPRLERFEAEAAAFVGTRHAIGVGNGTDALLLALRALGIGPGDEVITSAFSFFATVEAILHAGARPVLADVRPGTLNLDPAAAGAAVTDRTAALLPVHLYGQTADAEALAALADRHGLALVEDAAQAMGASTGDPARRAGALGDVACFSFYPTKNLSGVGDGGLVTTDDPEVATRVRRLRHHGQEGPGDRHREVGCNSRLDELQAAVLAAKLARLEAWNDRRREHARAYDRALGAGPGGRAADGSAGPAGPIRPPRERSGNRHVYHLYTVRCSDRDGLVRRLASEGIGHGIYYPRPLHLQEPLTRLGYVEGEFPEAERAAEEVLSVPVFVGLRETERERVAGTLERAARTLRGG